MSSQSLTPCRLLIQIYDNFWSTWNFFILPELALSGLTCFIQIIITFPLQCSKGPWFKNFNCFMCYYCGFLMIVLFWFNLLPDEFKCSTPTLFLLQFSVIHRVLFLCIQCFSLHATLWWYVGCATLFLPVMHILLLSCYEISLLFYIHIVYLP